MDDQRREEASAETAQAWDSVRRVREPVAWALLALTAIGVLVGTWELFGLPGSTVIGTPGSGSLTTFGFRAAAVAPAFVAPGILTLPVFSVILVAFTGGLTDRARQVAQAAVTIQAVALGLGVLSWLAATGAHTRPTVWFISDATDLAVAATALIFTVAVRRSRALRAPAPRFADFQEDEEDFGEAD